MCYRNLRKRYSTKLCSESIFESDDFLLFINVFNITRHTTYKIRLGHTWDAHQMFIFFKV